MSSDKCVTGRDIQLKWETLEGTLCTGCDTLVFKATRPDFGQTKSLVPLRLDLHCTIEAFFAAALTCPLCQFALQFVGKLKGGSSGIGQVGGSKSDFGWLKIEIWPDNEPYMVNWLAEMPPRSSKYTSILQAYLTESEYRSCPFLRCEPSKFCKPLATI